MRKRRLKIFFDGGCQPNPGEMETAVVARSILYHTANIGHGTNDAAEWLALIQALRVAQSLGVRDFELVGDSVLVVNQANGLQKCRSAALQHYLEEFRALAVRYPPARIRHIGRSQNLAGIALERIRGQR